LPTGRRDKAEIKVRDHNVVVNGGALGDNTSVGVKHHRVPGPNFIFVGANSVTEGEKMPLSCARDGSQRINQPRPFGP
jgi:hypothetical protein